MNFRYRIMQFMSGRYGNDKLGSVIFIAACILAFLNIRFHSITLQLIVYALIIYGIFRMLSRNIEARRRENRWFLDRFSAFKRKREIYNQRRMDKFHVYKKCPNCKAILRLPRKIGVHTTVCPKCAKEFRVRVRK